MKVSELRGAQLDYWVAKALGKNTKIEGCRYFYQLGVGSGFRWREVPAYSTKWARGGLIIQREKLVWKWANTLEGEKAICGSWENGSKSALIAAMRGFVERKFGKEVTE